MAISTDGYEFIKYKNNPILKPEYKFEKNSVMNPHVIYDKEEKFLKCGIQLVIKVNQM